LTVQERTGRNWCKGNPHCSHFAEGKFWGVIGFDDCREAKRRSPSELAVLKLLRIVLVVQSSAIATLCREEAALQRARELEEHNRVLGARSHFETVALMRY